WWLNAGGIPTFEITSEVATPANAQRLVARDTGVWIESNDTTRPSLWVTYVGAGQTSYPYVNAGTPTSPTTFGVASMGGTTNSDLQLSSAGPSSSILLTATAVKMVNVTPLQWYLSPTRSEERRV